MSYEPVFRPKAVLEGGEAERELRHRRRFAQEAPRKLQKPSYYVVESLHRWERTRQPRFRFINTRPASNINAW